MIRDGISKYMGDLVVEHYLDREAMVNKEIPYHRPSSKIQMLRAAMKKAGIDNPRIDRGFKIF